MNGARRIRSEKLRKHHCREGYSRSLQGKSVKCDEENNVERMWEQVKCAMIDSARKACSSVRVKDGNTMIVWWNEEVKPQL